MLEREQWHLQLRNADALAEVALPVLICTSVSGESRVNLH